MIAIGSVCLLGSGTLVGVFFRFSFLFQLRFVFEITVFGCMIEFIAMNTLFPIPEIAVVSLMTRLHAMFAEQFVVVDMIFCIAELHTLNLLCDLLCYSLEEQWQ